MNSPQPSVKRSPSTLRNFLKSLWAFSGFGSSIDSDGKVQRAKTLWDWLQLLFVPLLIAGGIAVYQNITQAHETELAANQAQVDRDIALDNAQETALENYIDRMEDLLLNKNLTPQSPLKSEAVVIAQTMTLTVLPRLDAARKSTVLQFLSNAGIIPLISLNGTSLMNVNLTGVNLAGASLNQADLTDANLLSATLAGASLNQADLTEANLSLADLSDATLTFATLTNANLSDAHLTGANLKSARLAGATLAGATLITANLSYCYLADADLIDANLTNADLSVSLLSHATLSGATLTNANLSNDYLADADLTNATLSGAALNNADLTDADLAGADFSGTTLNGAKVTSAQLATVKSLAGATMPDGTKHA